MNYLNDNFPKKVCDHRCLLIYNLKEDFEEISDLIILKTIQQFNFNGSIDYIKSRGDKNSNLLDADSSFEDQMENLSINFFDK